MKKIGWNWLLIVSGLLFSLPAFAQQTWERTYGGPGNDEGRYAQQTTDGGYIITGGTTSLGYGYHVYLIKTDSSGDTLWTRIYGGDESFGTSVQQTTDGGYIVAGYTFHFGSNEVYLIKTNTFGDTLWTKTYGGTGTDLGFSVQQTSDGGYIVAGQTTSFGNSVQVYLIKTNASGDSLWTRTYGGINWDEGWFVKQTSDSGYIVAGRSSSFGNSEQVYLIKTDASGDTLWTRNFGGSSYEVGLSVQQTTDGGYIITGGSTSFGYGSQVYLIKTNASGDTLWTRNFGGGGDEQGRTVQQTPDGGYIIAGTTNSFGYPYQVYLIKTNASGIILWAKTYGWLGRDEGYSVQQTTDGGYIVAGATTSFGDSSQVYLIKTDANGNSGVEEDSPGRIKPPTSNLYYSVVPNPFSSFASVPGHSSERFALYDVSGRKVGSYMGDRIGFDLSAGIYFLKPKSKDAKPLRLVKLR